MKIVRRKWNHVIVLISLVDRVRRRFQNSDSHRSPRGDVGGLKFTSSNPNFQSIAFLMQSLHLFRSVPAIIMSILARDPPTTSLSRLRRFYHALELQIHHQLIRDSPLIPITQSTDSISSTPPTYSNHANSFATTHLMFLALFLLIYYTLEHDLNSY